MNQDPAFSNYNPIDSSLNEHTRAPQTFFSGSRITYLSDLQNTFFSRIHELARYHLDAGNYTQGLLNLDKCIDYLSNNLEGSPKSSVLKDFITEVVGYLNEEALLLLKKDKPLESLRLLEKCKDLTSPEKYGTFPKPRSLTFNHIGCCYRRIGNLEKALYHLDKALQFVQGVDRIGVSGITHINLCAVLSQMQNHKKALEHAKLAVSECAYDLIHTTKEAEAESTSETRKKTNYYKATMLAIAYHNLGIEESFCGDEEASMQAYYKAYKLVEEHVGTGDKLYKKFKQAHDDIYERIMKSNRKSVPARKKAPSLTKKAKSNIYFKKPTLFSTNTMAAKVYLQNGRVVIPNFKDYKEKKEPKEHKSQKSIKSTRPLSNTMSIGNASKIVKPAAPIEKKPREKKRQRPLTANARTENSGVEGKSWRKNNKVPKQGDNGASDSEGNSELEKFVLEDEEELEWINMKSNRLTFLNQLNQFSTHKSALDDRKINSKNQSDLSSHPQGGQEDEITPKSYEFSSPKSKKSPSELGQIFQKSPNKFEFSSPKQNGSPDNYTKGDSKPISLRGKSPLKNNQQARLADSQELAKAAITLQKNWKAYNVRKQYKDEIGESAYVTIMARTVDKILEKKGTKKGMNRYYVLMMYNYDDEFISIQIKNLQTKKYYKTVVPFRPKNDGKGLAKKLLEELKSECEDLLDRLSILDGCIVLLDDLKKQKSSARPAMDLKKEDKYFSETGNTLETPKSEESDFMPLLTKMKANQQKGMFNSFKEGFSKKIPLTESVGITIGDSPKGSILKSPSHRRKVVRPFSGMQKLVSTETEHRKPMPPSDEEDDTTNPNTDNRKEAVKPDRKGLSRGSAEEKKEDKSSPILFSQSTSLGGHLLEFKIQEKASKDRRSKPILYISCYDLTARRSLNELNIPRDLFHLKELTVQDLLRTLNIDLEAGKMSLKKGIPYGEEIVTEDDKADDFTPKPMFALQKIESLEDRQDSMPESARLSKKNTEGRFSTKNERTSSKKKEKNDVSGIPSQSDDDILLGIGPLINRGDKTDSDYDGREFVVPIHFAGSNSLNCIVQHDRTKKEVKIKYKKQNSPDNRQNTLTVPSDLLDIPSKGFPKKSFVENMSIILASRLTLKDGELVIKERGKVPRKVEETTSPNEEDEFDRDEDTDYLRDSQIELMTAKIQKALQSQMSGDSKGNESQGKKDKGIQENVRKRRFVKANDQSTPKGRMSLEEEKPTEFNEADLIQEAIKIGEVLRKDNEKNGSKKQDEEMPEEIEEELPDLEDKEVQEATLKIQKAYKNKLAKKQVQSQSVQKPKENVRSVKEEKKVEAKQEKPAIMKQEKPVIMKQGSEKRSPGISKEKKKIGGLIKENNQKKQEEEELPDLNDENVQKATLTIQKAYKKREKNNEKKKEAENPVNVKEERKLQKTGAPKMQQVSLSQESGGIKKPTMPVQINFMDKQVSSGGIKEKAPQQQHLDNVEEELPDLNDKDVQNAALTIQQAYKKKKDKQNVQKSNAIRSSSPQKIVVQEKEVKKINKVEKKVQEEEEEELPDLGDPNVQNATLVIQKAYLKKKDKAKDPNKGKQPVETRVQNDKKQGQVGQKEEVIKVKKGQEQQKQPVKEEEELPNLEDKEVQNATLTIQKAYKKRKAKGTEKVETKTQPKEKISINISKLEESAPQKAQNNNKEVKTVAKKQNEEEEELPNLDDPEVQNAALTIQKAYIKKKKVVKAPEIKESPKKDNKKKEEEEEEMPNLEDAEVQQATLKIQKAYMKKKNRAKGANNTQSPQKESHKEEEELPNLEDQDVQKATLTIQKAYKKKKARTDKSEKTEQSPSPKKVEQVDKEELPNLEDPEVQNATLTIQKAYIKKKKGTQKAKEPEKKVTIEEKKEEEELPNLQDPEVQNATLAIQKAYMKKKGWNHDKNEKPKADPILIVEEEEKKEKNTGGPVKKEQGKEIEAKEAPVQKKKENPYLPKNIPQIPLKGESKSEKKIQVSGITMQRFDKKKPLENQAPVVQTSTTQVQQVQTQQEKKEPQKVEEKEEKEELPDLGDPEVEKATLTIQKAYKKKLKEKGSGQHEQDSMGGKDSMRLETGNNNQGDGRTGGNQFSHEKSGEDPDSATKKNPSSPYRWRSQRSYTGEIPRIVIHMEDDSSPSTKSNRLLKTEPGKGYQEDLIEKRRIASLNNHDDERRGKEDDGLDLPNLEDPDVERAAVTIQKAYKKRKGGS